MRRIITGLLVIAGLTVGVSAQEAKRSIEQVKGDVYRFQNNFHYALFVVTDAGIVVTDPINADAVGWLRGELAKRFNKPVTHMIYSHNHGDHASGGEAWGNAVKVITHKDNDVKNATPRVTFSDTHVLKVGGKTLELTYLGKGHGNGMIAVVVRPENVAFVVDVVSPARLPYRDFPGMDIAAIIGQIKKVESLDFDIMAPGHSRLGNKKDTTDARIYIEKLMAGVKKALAEGKSADDIIASDLVSDYKDWRAYNQYRPLNISGMVKWLQ
jgi:glyoxylase-like metal-dependent hydrolase (beta-lactamase superfamily II)